MIILFLISLFAFFLAPNQYSFVYCACLNALYLYTAFYINAKDKKRDFPGYHLLFSISFYCVNFIYPVFVYPIAPDVSMFSHSSFSDTIITKCTALAMLCYSVYGLGYINQLRKEIINYGANIRISRSGCNRALIWTATLFCVIVMFGGLEYFSDQYMNENSGKVSSIVKYILLFLPPSLLLLSVTYKFCNYFKQRVLIIFCVVIISLFIIMTGSRTIPLMAFVALGYIFVQVHNVNKKYVAIAMACGIILMSVIGDLRYSGISGDISEYGENDSDLGQVYHLLHLFICNRNLYAAYDIVQHQGITYGISMLGPILSPIPLLQSLFVIIFGIKSYMMGSATLLTVYDLGPNSSIGLGTNIVSDVYLAFGLLGILLFFYLGKFVVYARSRMRQNSFVWTLVYVGYVANAIYSCRSSFIGDVRLVLWAIMFGYILYKRESIFKSSTIK